jgi:uncharacterized ion transporter superfamily protein YfcC
MNHKSPYEKANELIKLAKQEKNPVIRKLRLRAAEKYYQADVSKVMKPKRDFTKDLLVILLFYVVIVGTAIFSFSKLGFWAGVGVVIGTFALLTLMMGVILRVRGDISETSFIAMVREGSKALLLLGKTDKSTKGSPKKVKKQKS